MGPARGSGVPGERGGESVVGSQTRVLPVPTGKAPGEREGEQGASGIACNRAKLR